MENTQPHPSWKSRVSRLIPLIFYVLLAIFLVIYLKTIDFAELQGVDISWAYVIVGSIISLGFRYWGSYVWFVLLKALGARNLSKDIPGLVYVYAKSWLGRYIPGTVPWILGKIYFASRHGISKHKLAVSSLLEGALQIVATLALAFSLLILDPRLDVIDPRLKLLMAGVLIACIIAMTPVVFNKLVSLAYKIIRKKDLDPEHLPGNKTVGKGAALYLFGAFFFGLSFFFIAKAIYPELSYNDALFVIGASNLAGAIGMLAIFVPSGIGVREGVQVLLLSVIMPLEVAIIIAVVMRLWSVIIDFLFFGFAYISKVTRAAKAG